MAAYTHYGAYIRANGAVYSASPARRAAAVDDLLEFVEDFRGKVPGSNEKGGNSSYRRMVTAEMAYQFRGFDSGEVFRHRIGQIYMAGFTAQAASCKWAASSGRLIPGRSFTARLNWCAMAASG